MYQRQPELPEDWGSIASLYDIEHPACRGDEARFWHDRATEARTMVDGPILELASGSGRVCLALARKGHRVTGLELSSIMVDRATARSSRLSPSVRDRTTWVVGDMTDFIVGDGTFSLVFVAFNSFWLLDDAGQDECLAMMRRHLAPGGRIVIDVFPPTVQDYTDEDSISQFLGRKWHGRSVLRVKDYRYLIEPNAAISDVRYYSTDRDPRSPASMIGRFTYILHPESPERVEARLCRAGFTVIETFGEYRGEPISPDSARAIFIATVTQPD
ncbi:MAG: class I SAM-dependent methyltransferase [Chloroflexi bacterium]|nr:class I SAM-dependent methyltransferase [Chloroflexota bacterium]